MSLSVCRSAALRGFAVLLICLIPVSSFAQATVPNGFEDTSVAAVAYPTALAFVPDGRLLIAAMQGQIYVWQKGSLVPDAALDLSGRVCAYRERGLVGLAVDPEFTFNHFVYVSYSFDKYGTCDAELNVTPVGRVSRFQLGDDNRMDPGSEEIILDNVPSIVGVHNLDDVRFGPDGYLYVTVGDSGCDYAGDSGCFDTNDAARDLNTLVGKVLRITRNGDVPADNPFDGPGSIRCATIGYGPPGSRCREIFATGLRNPWRLAFDPNTSAARFFINDVGQDTWEEVNEGRAGADYGWNQREGFCANSSTTDCAPTAPEGLTNPAFAYDRSEGCSAITGGAFVPNGLWPSEFDGSYLFGDYVCGKMFRLVPLADGGFTADTFASDFGGSSIVDMAFGPSDAGNALYYLTHFNGGEVRRITFVSTSNRHPNAIMSASPQFGPSPLEVVFDGTASFDPDNDQLICVWDFGDGSPPENGPTAVHTYTGSRAYTATLTVSDPAGATSSATLRIDADNNPPEPVIETPLPSHTFAVGDTIVLRGSAIDPEDGAITNAFLTWRVILHHNTHVHGFLPATTGNNLTFVAPAPENLEAAANSYLEIQLTATDSRGATRTVTQSLLPRLIRLDFTSDPDGARLRIDNATVETPLSVMSWANFGVVVEAPLQTSPDGSTLVFGSWSDGGLATHTIVTPPVPASYTARFGAEADVELPYTGTPVALPGVLEMENFDNGGAGVVYEDTSAGNSGGEYRSTDVDIAAAADAGGGHVVGWTEAGEWLVYSATVAAAGSYDLEFRVASAGPGGTFHVEVNGEDVTGAITVPDTGDWQAWRTIRRPAVNLPAGPQAWRVVMDSVGETGAVGNFNWLRVVSTDPAGARSEPWTGSAVVLPGVIQAENFDIGGPNLAYADSSPGNAGGQYRPGDDVDVAIAADSGSGYTLGWTVPGEWLNYSVSIEAAGAYDLDFRVASNGPGGDFHLEVDGIDTTGAITIPDTGGWQSWNMIRRADVHLSAGPQVWRLVMDSTRGTGAIGNIDWISVSPSTGSPGSTPYTGAPIALPGVIQAEDFDLGPAGVAYSDTTSGNSGGGYRPTDVDIAGAADSGGGYVVGWTDEREWLAYSVDVAAAGRYDIEVRVASDGAGGTFHIEANGADVTGPLSVPDTAGWQSWITVRRTGVSLSAGTQIWRLVFDANGETRSVGNVNWIAVSAASSTPPPPTTPFGGTPATIPGLVEAENFDEGESGAAYWDSDAGNIGGLYRPASGVDIGRVTDGSGGYTIGWTSAAEWLAYTVNVSAEGTYDIEIRGASNGPGGTFHLEVDGVNKTGPLAIPDTGGWQSWVTIASRGVPLNVGQQVWRVVLDSVGPTGAVGNIDWIRATPTVAASAGFSRGPYLQQMTPTAVVVAWATRVPSPGEVRFGPEGGGSPRAAPAVMRTISSSTTGLPFDIYQYEARLTGLSPSSRYTYDVFMAGADATLGQQTFTTAPPVGTGAVRFVAFGDSGVGSSAQRQVAARLATETFDLAIHSGDVAYGSTEGIGAGDYSTFDAWVFDIYRAWLSVKPFFPSIGNHDDEFDNARAYRDVFVLPANGATATYPDHAERYYSYDYGPVHFVVLDTELAFQDPARRAAQVAWLEADLASTSQPWRIAYFHRPPFNAGFQHGSSLDVRDAFVPVFERYGVQLVISGHEHGYQRSVPIRQYLAGGPPIVYVVTGGGGAPLYSLGSEAWTAATAEAHHYVRVSVSGCSLDGEAVRSDGEVIDSFAVNRCAMSSVPAVTTDMPSDLANGILVPDLSRQR